MGIINKIKLLRKLIKRLGRILEKYGFYIMQGFILLIIWLFYINNFLLPVDTYVRSIFLKFKNNIVTNSEISESKIALVALDSKFFEKEDLSIQGLHRGYYAQALENINKHDPALVVIDVFFQKKYNFKGDNKRIDALNKIFGQFDEDLAKQFNKNTILAGLYDFNENKILKPDDYFLQYGAIYGHTHSLTFNKGMHLGPYGILEDKVTKEKIYPLSIITFAEYIKKQYRENYINTNKLVYEINDLENFIDIKVPGIINYKIPKNSYYNKQDIIFHPIYLSNTNQLKTETSPGKFEDTNKDQYISFYDAYSGTISDSEIKDKIIFVGATDVALNDIKQTLLGDIEGVLQHINLFLSLKNKDFIYILNKKPQIGRLPKIDQYFIIIFGIIFLNLIALIYLRQTKAHTHILLLMLFEIIIISIIGILLSLEGNYKIFGLGYSLFLPLGNIVILVFIQIVLTGLYAYLDTYKLKESFQNLFKVYVGKNKAQEKLSGDIDADHKTTIKTNAAIFFSDIAGFTDISETLNPEENINMLNIYLEEMTSKIEDYKGTLDKFIGDAIMAYWTKNENPCYLAAKTAIANVSELEKTNLLIQNKLGKEKIPDNLIQIRIGLHYGKVIEGDIGSKQKLDRTIIGDSVNLASRLEGINKFYSTQIIMSAEFNQYLSNEFIRRKIDRIKVKGKKSAIEIYQLLPFYTNMKSQEELEKIYKFIEQFEEGLEKYFTGNFVESLEILKNNHNFHPDPTTQLMIKRIEKLIENQPNKWDGTWSYDVK